MGNKELPKMFILVAGRYVATNDAFIGNDRYLVKRVISRTSCILELLKLKARGQLSYFSKPAPLPPLRAHLPPTQYVHMHACTQPPRSSSVHTCR